MLLDRIDICIKNLVLGNVVYIDIFYNYINIIIFK